jgi:hypothetical protein
VSGLFTQSGWTARPDVADFRDGFSLRNALANAAERMSPGDSERIDARAAAIEEAALARVAGAHSATVLGFFWSATINTMIFVRWSALGFREMEWIAVGGS